MQSQSGKLGRSLYSFIRDAKQRQLATGLKSKSNGAGFSNFSPILGSRLRKRAWRAVQGWVHL